MDLYYRGHHVRHVWRCSPPFTPRHAGAFREVAQAGGAALPQPHALGYPRRQQAGG